MALLRTSNYLIILLFFAGFVASLFFLKTEITVQSRGVFRAATEPVQLTAPVVAEVSKTILRENQTVSEGDTLIWLNSDKQKERIAFLLKRIEENEAYLSDISLMLGSKCDDIKTHLYKAVHAQYNQKLAEFNLKIDLEQKSFNRAKILFNKQVISATEIEDKKFRLDQALEEKRIYIQASRNEWQRSAVGYRQENKNYKSEIESLKNDIRKYTILAPIAGHIANFTGVKAGSFVSTGQTIAVISPDEHILAEHLVSPQDIGYLQKNMPVVFQVDAYNYNQWGVASGNITDISNEIYIVNNQPFFKVRSSLDQSCLSLKNGFKGELKKGLTATARFKITQRTLAQLLFDKTDNWLNPKIISE